MTSVKYEWLHIPQKTTYEIDIGSVFSAFIKKEYGAKMSSLMADTCKQMRINALLAANKPEISTMKHMFVYLAQIQNARKRFSFGPRAKLQFSFTWSDANDSFCQIEAEEAAIIYNIASVYSTLALSFSDTVDGFMEASKNFQKAAGCLKDILGNSEGSSTNLFAKLENIYTTSDFTHHGISMNINLMLAQAHTCVFAKAIITNMKAATVCRISRRAADLYTLALDHAKELKEVLPPAFLHQLMFQSLRYLSCSYFYKSKTFEKCQKETDTGFGIEIGYLNVSFEYIKQAISEFKLDKSHKISVELLDLAKQIQLRIQNDLESKKKDNNFLYHEAVPEKDSLAIIQPFDVAKPISLTSFWDGEHSHSSGDLFSVLESTVLGFEDEPSTACSIL